MIKKSEYFHGGWGKFILLKSNYLLGKENQFDGKLTTYQKLISFARLAERQN